MMEKKVHRQLLNDALKTLTQKRLNDALIIMRTLCMECGEYELTNRFESIESDYHAMLDFIAHGGEDEQKYTNHIKLLKRTFTLLSMLEQSLVLGQFKSRLHPELYEPNVIHHDELEDVFYKVFAERIDPFETELIPGETMELMFTSMHVIAVANVVNAYWVSNPETLDTLLSCCDEDEPGRLNLIGIILSTMLHPQIYQFYPELKEAVRRLLNDDELQESIMTIYNEIFLSCQAERIEQHMKDEMMPMMMEAAKDKRLQQEMNEEMMNADEEMDEFEKLMKQQELTPLTPEQRKKKKQLHSALNELMDIHNEGIDINTEIFDFAARLPFFTELANWFLPFNPHHPAIEPICYPNGKPNILFRMLFDIPTICDIDKYAMTMIMGKKVKSSNMEVIISDMQRIMEESEALKGMDFVMPRKSEKELISDFIHTLYRFVTKSRWKEEMPNVFAQELPFCTDELLSIPLRKNMQATLELADRMWKFGAKEEAVKLYKFADRERQELDVNRCLKVAQYYDEQFSNEGDKYIERAFESDPTNRDVLIAEARKYERHAEFDKLIHVLEKLTGLYPEDTEAILWLADTYLTCDRWSQANQQFFKLEYLGKKVVKAQRGIVLCALHEGKFDVALRYSRKLFNTPGVATWSDYLRGGHAAWLISDMTSALTFYHMYIKNYLCDDPSITDALEPFNDDSRLLEELGKSATDIALMRDMITLKSI